MDKFNDEHLEEEFKELLNSGKISKVWYDACDEKWWEDATWENFFTEKRAQILFCESPYLPKYINKINRVFKIIFKLQEDIQIGNEIEMRFFSELMISDYLVLRHEMILDNKYLASCYYNKGNRIKKYSKNKIPSKNFTTPFVLATTKLLNLWMEKRNLIILKETKEFSEKNIVLNKYENELTNIKQAFYEKNCDLIKLSNKTSKSVIVYSFKRKDELEEMLEKWHHNIRGACNCVERYMLKEYREVDYFLREFDDTFKELEPEAIVWRVLPPVFENYKNIFLREFEFLWCLEKQYTTGVSFDEIKQLVETYAEEKQLSNYRKKMLIMTITVSMAITCTRSTLEEKKEETMLNPLVQTEEIPNFPKVNDNKVPNKLYPKNDTTFLNDVENTPNEKTTESEPSLTEEINIGKYIEFENKNYYVSIYDESPKNITSAKGYVIAYFPYKYTDEKIEYFGSLRSTDELNQFFNQHKDEIAEFYWKAAFVTGTFKEEIKTYIDSEEAVPSQYTTYFIDYEPFTRELKK